MIISLAFLVLFVVVIIVAITVDPFRPLAVLTFVSTAIFYVKFSYHLLSAPTHWRIRVRNHLDIELQWLTLTVHIGHRYFLLLNLRVPYFS